MHRAFRSFVTIKALMASTMVLATTCLFAADFTSSPLSSEYQSYLKSTGLWSQSCPVELQRLRDLRISYYDFNGHVHHNGHLIVMDAVAKDVIGIFKSLYQKRFPIHKMVPTSEYGGDDKLSLRANNTSAYNCRAITGGSLPSIHSYGLAIDVNTVQNPYLSFDEDKGLATVLPAAGSQFINRHNQRRGMVEPIVELFHAGGFTVWGGRWNTPIDYQHFQTSRFVAILLAHLPPQAAAKFYKLAKENPEAIKILQTKQAASVIRLYDQYPKRFLSAFQKCLPELSQRDSQYFMTKLTRILSE